MKWTNLEPIIRREVSQKEKARYGILTRIHTYIYMESRKMVLMNLSTGQQQRCRQREQTCTQSGRKKAERFERVALKHIHYQMESIQPVGVCCMTQGIQGWCSVTP